MAWAPRLGERPIRATGSSEATGTKELGPLATRMSPRRGPATEWAACAAALRLPD
jgi:hypothetical protein